MATKDTPTPERLSELFRYDPETGHLFRRDNGEPVKESRAGPKGRLQVFVGGRHTMRYVARVAWAMTYGAWPKGQIDHINQDHTDNRWVNLREATDQENVQNVTKPNSRNRSGLRGVSFDHRTHNWRARITLNGTTVHLGMFDSAESASVAYFRAKREMHPFWVPLQQSESVINDPQSATSHRVA